MRRKMDLLEQAHGLLCNAPDRGGATSPEAVAEWERLRADWIRRWEHVIADQAVKEHNARIAIGNEAITEYDRSAGSAPGMVRPRMSVYATPTVTPPETWRNPMTMTTTRAYATMAEAWAELKANLDEYGAASVIKDPETRMAATADVFADEARIWARAGGVELDSPACTVFALARARALSLARQFARDYIRSATTYGQMRYLDDAQASGVTYGERVA